MNCEACGAVVPQDAPEKDGEYPGRLCHHCKDRFDERAGILEFDAGLSKKEAETKAWSMMRTRPRSIS